MNAISVPEGNPAVLIHPHACACPRIDAACLLKQARSRNIGAVSGGACARLSFRLVCAMPTMLPVFRAFPALPWPLRDEENGRAWGIHAKAARMYPRRLAIRSIRKSYSAALAA
jgi:hypothetical protein